MSHFCKLYVQYVLVFLTIYSPGTQYSHNITRHVFLLNVKAMQPSEKINYLFDE